MSPRFYGVHSAQHLRLIISRVCAALGNGKLSTVDNQLEESCCAESQFATYQDPTPNGAGRGVGQCDLIAFNDVIARTRSKDKAKVAHVFGYKLHKLKHEQLDNDPLLAIIIMRLHYKLIPDVIPETVAKRARYWKKFYNTEAGRGTEEHYIISAKECLGVYDEIEYPNTKVNNVTNKDSSMFGSISTALKLADTFGLTDWLNSKFAGSGDSIKVAEKVIDVAKQVTGVTDPINLIDSDVSPTIISSVKAQILEQEHEIDKLAFADRAGARDMYNEKSEQADQIARNIMTWNLPMISIMVLIQVAAIHYMGDKGAVLGVISNVIGMVLNALITERQQVAGFFFGSSLGSKLKNKNV